MTLSKTLRLELARQQYGHLSDEELAWLLGYDYAPVTRDQMLLILYGRRDVANIYREQYGISQFDHAEY